MRAHYSHRRVRIDINHYNVVPSLLSQVDTINSMIKVDTHLVLTLVVLLVKKNIVSNKYSVRTLNRCESRVILLLSL